LYAFHVNKNIPTHTLTQSTQKSTAPALTFISSNLVNKASWKTKTALSSDHLHIIIHIDTSRKLNLEQTKQTYKNYRNANWNGFTEDIEIALSTAQNIYDVHKGNKVITDLIISADRRHIKKKIKERNILRISNHCDPRFLRLNKEITDLIGKHRTDQ